MDNQKERSRLDEENSSDKNTDVTRDQRRQETTNTNESRNVSNPPAEGDNHHFGGDETGAHREGTYDKQSSKPMTDRELGGSKDQ